MIVPVQLPPGAYRNGTEYQSRGRWRDVNLVRWHEGALRPVGGFTITGTAGVYSDTGLGHDDPPSFGLGSPGSLAWVDNSGNQWVLFAMAIGAVVYDVTNGRTYGLSSSFGSNGEWSWDTFGEIPLGCNSVQGQILEWDLNTANNLTQVSNSPTSCKGVVVPDERFVFALGAGGEPKRIEWSDRGDRTVWTPAATNQAGGFDLDTEGEIQFGLQMRGEVLIVTTTDCWVARYVGYPDVWSFIRIGSCTSISRNARARVNDVAYWMGDGEFYQYSGGHVEKLPCPVSEHVFGNLRSGNETDSFAWHNVEYGEVWFHYPVSSNSNADSAVSFSPSGGYWSTHSGLPFSSIAERGVTAKPLALSVTRSGIDYTLASDPGGFTLGTNWQFSGGSLNQSAPSASSASFSPSTTEDHGYIVKVTVANRTAGTLTVTAGDDSVAVSSNGEVFLPFTATGSQTTISFDADGTWDGDLNDVIVNQEWIFQVEDDTNFYYSTTTPYAETGPLEIAPGERRVMVSRLYPDEQATGELSYTFKHREYPNATEVSETAVVGKNPTSVRFSGRQFRLRVAPDTTTNMIDNGTFADDAGWTLSGAGWSITGGVLDGQGTGSADTATYTCDRALTEGDTYVVTFTVTGRTQGGVTMSLGGTNGTRRTTDGTYTEDIVAGTTQDLVFTLDDLGGPYNGNIDNVTVVPKAYDWRFGVPRLEVKPMGKR